MKNSIMDGLVFYYRLRRYIQDHKITHRKQFDKLRRIFFDNLWQTAASKIGAKAESFGYGFVRVNYNSHFTFVLNSMVMLDNHLTLKIAGNKALVLRLLKEQNIPIQNYLEYDIYNLSKAYRFLKEHDTSCVVKPAGSTGSGNGITTKIQTYEQLKKASYLAATFDKRLLIEEEIPGDSFRLLYLNGQLLDVVKRQAPQVIGDGKHNLKYLILKENQDRLKGDPIVALSPLEIDYECKLNLQHRGYSLSHVPKESEKISVKTAVNQNRYTENESISEGIHPSIISMGQNIAKLLNWKLLGVDLITPDISKPLDKVHGVVNEINTTPGLHHHYLIKNKENTVPIAESILEYILKQ
jgi:cyanophycin synthetase